MDAEDKKRLKEIEKDVKKMKLIVAGMGQIANAVFLGGVIGFVIKSVTKVRN